MEKLANRVLLQYLGQNPREAETTRQMTHGAASEPAQPTDTSRVDLTA